MTLTTAFNLKDSGERRNFPTGAVRDTAGNKERPDLISPFAEARVGKWMGLGADKYGDRNWEKGMPFSVFWASLKRHVNKFAKGWTDEDHLAAIIFNAQAIIHFQETGRKELDDMPKYQDGPSNMPSLIELPPGVVLCNCGCNGYLITKAGAV